MDYRSDYYYLGKITKKHGLKGSFIIYLDTDEPKFYDKLESVFIDYDGNLVPFFLDASQNRRQGQKLITSFQHVPEGITLEALINKELYLPLADLPPLTGKKFYYHEIIGFSLYNQSDEIGKIQSVMDFGPQPQFSIQQENEKDIYIPIIMDWISNIDREKQVIIMDLPDGILNQY